MIHRCSIPDAATRRMGRAGVLLALLVASTGCWTGNLINIGGEGRGPLREALVHGESGDPKLLLVPIDGIISESPTSAFLSFSESTVARLREVLDKARKDPELRGVLLRIDSPGGTASGSEMAYAELRRFKRDSGLPVVAHLMGTATSGGYYVAMGADEIVAEPTTVTGSIGVIFFGVNVSGLMERFGVEDQTITAGRYKDAGSPLRPMRPEERRHFQAVIDDMHRRFKDVVIEGRPALGAERVETLADGSIYSAPQALDHGLIDAIGDIESSVERLRSKAGLPRASVVVYHRPGGWRQNLYTVDPAPQPRVQPASAPAETSALLRLLPAVGRGFHYLWLGATP